MATYFASTDNLTNPKNRVDQRLDSCSQEDTKGRDNEMHIKIAMDFVFCGLDVFAFKFLRGEVVVYKHKLERTSCATGPISSGKPDNA